MAVNRDPQLQQDRIARRVWNSLSSEGKQFVLGFSNNRQHQEAVRRTIARANGVTGHGVTAKPKTSSASEQAALILQRFGKTPKRKSPGGLKAPKKQDLGTATYRPQLRKNFR